MPRSHTDHLRAGESACPTCGAPAEQGQLVCLECGSRVALDYRRPPSWRVPVAIVAVVVLLVGAASALALKGIGDDAERDAADTPITVTTGPARTGATKQGTAPAKKDGAARKAPAAKTTPAEGQTPAKRKTPDTADAPPAAPGELAQRGALYNWPRELDAFTVVLISTEDRASADRFARSAAEGRPAKVGVIRADDFKSLPKGFYLVFAGKYENRALADRAAARLGKRFPGAFPQLVKR